ncbi:tyrosine-type recombinase/integrase [Paenibacillus macerans]|uniref:tyrosine-type recombinase/integrase n=1 Tax=Paenibacillus macerans TaxID=44252 RepID=UPI003D322DF8
MKGHYYKPHCKCPKDKRCKCNATWSYIVDIGQGERKQKKKGGFKTKAEAEKAAALLIAEVEKGEYVKEGKITFGDFTKDWLKTYANTGVKPSTLRLRNYEVGKLNAHLEKIKLKDITHNKYQTIINDLGEKVGFSTLSGIHTTGQMIFEYALKTETIRKDPTKYTVLKKEIPTVDDLEQDSEIPKYLEKKQLTLFLESAKTVLPNEAYIIFLTLAYTGMRIGEMSALKWKDVDLGQGTISVTKTLYNPGNTLRGYALVPPKSKKSKRIIEIGEILINELRNHKDQLEAVKEKHPTYHDEDFVFCQFGFDNAGFPIYPALLRRYMKRILAHSELGIDITPHSLRHTHCSLLAEAGVSLEAIMNRLGHSNANTTRNIYLHVTKTKSLEASQKFDELMKDQ